MAETTGRVLRLLGLLQSRRVWSGAELAARLGVTTCSVRRDIERLRDLGYPVHASRGHGGGYQLGAGAALPPLLLDPDEAVAVAVCLRLAAGGSVAGVGEAALRALGKLDQVMPARLRAQGSVFTPRPAPDAARFVQRAITAAPYRHVAQVRFHAPEHVVARHFPPSTVGIEADGAQACIVTTGADDPHRLVLHLAAVGCEFEVLSPPEVARAAAELSGRLARAAPREQP